MRGVVKEYVLEGTKLMTDAFPSYRKLQGEYEHQFVDHAVAYVNGKVHTNGLENFWSLLKRSIHGTFVCPRPFHLFRYLDEQAFKFNERKGTDAERFDLAMEGVSGKRLTYKGLTGKARTA